MQQALVQPVQNQAPRHKYEDRRLEITWFAFGIRIYIPSFFPAQLTSHSVGKFSCWVVVLGQRKMCRRDSESREKRDCSFITSSIIIRHDVTFSHGNWVSMSTHLCWENSRRPSIFQQRQPFLQFSPIIEMLLPIYHGSLKAFIIVHLSCRWHTYHTYKYV